MFLSPEYKISIPRLTDSAKNAEDKSLQLSNKEKNHLGEPVRSGCGAGVAPEYLVTNIVEQV